jgi:hypothetical protein
MANSALDAFVELYKSTANDLQKFDGKNEAKIEAELTAALTKNTQMLIDRLKGRLETLRTHQGDYGADFNVRIAALEDQIRQLQAKPPEDTPPPQPPNEHGVIPQPHIIAEDTPVHPAVPRARKRRKRGGGGGGAGEDNG